MLIQTLDSYSIKLIFYTLKIQPFDIQYNMGMKNLFGTTFHHFILVVSLVVMTFPMI